MDDTLRSEIAAIARDSRSGATELVGRAVAVLRAAALDRAALGEVADELCRAQPSMAGVRVAADIARRSPDPVTGLEAFAMRVARAPGAIARHAVALLKLRRRDGPIRLVTCSRSAAVELTIRELVREIAVEVACCEGRPALEGRDLAAALATTGVDVSLYTDAGVATALVGAEAFLTGADAIGPDAFINKVGTAALAALASLEGVPVYVLAGREKFLSGEMFSQLPVHTGPPAEVWSDAPAGVVCRNPYFEHIRTTLVAAFVTDGGVR